MGVAIKEEICRHLADGHGYTAEVLLAAPSLDLFFAVLPGEALADFHSFLHSSAKWSCRQGHEHDDSPGR